MSGLIPAELDPRFEVFRAWVATQKARAAGSSKKRDQFSDNTARIYASLWRGWVDWLGARNRQWHEATPADVRTFLDGPAPAPEDRRTRAPIQDKKMANYTQQRYWSVLQAVYAHAKINELVEHSPCEGIAVKPHVTEQSQLRQVLLPGVLWLLRDPDAVKRFLPMPHEGQWWLLRDRAALALAAHCALPTGELSALRGLDLRDGARMLEPRRPQLPGVPRAALLAQVDVPAQGDREARSIPIPPEALVLLEPWLERRAQLLRDQQAAFRKGELKVPPQPAGHAPLLLSREATAGEPLPAVDSPTIYYSFRKVMHKAIVAAGHKLEEIGYVAMGPSILRNTVIADWSAKLPAQEVARLAGVKPASLRATARAHAKAA